jgi:hypothetical protein
MTFNGRKAYASKVLIPTGQAYCMVCLLGNLVRLPSAYASFTKKKNILNKTEKIFPYTSPQSKCIRKVLKKDIVFGLCKKVKKMPCEKSYLRRILSGLFKHWILLFIQATRRVDFL